MNKTNEATPRPEGKNDIVVLGVASIETKGGSGEPIEPLGENMGFGISEK
jgi:hypothetical protein